MKKSEIIGYVKRKRDGCEYVLFKTDGRMCLTNGVFIWRDRIENRYLPQCVATEKINLGKMIENLKKFQPYSPVLTLLLEKSVREK